MDDTEVSVIKGLTAPESVLKGIEMLGDISTIIKEGEKVFIKFNLNNPGGFPTNTSIEVLTAIVKACKHAKAGKIYLGSFPSRGITIKKISSLLNLEEYFKNLGAELVFLDKSDLFNQKKVTPEQLNNIKNEAFSRLNVNEKEFLVPKIILDSDKLIAVNQVNVNPLFQINSSLLNLFSIISPKYQEFELNNKLGEEYVLQDQYKINLISNILDISTIKKPDLVINDLFYVLEGAGPFIYSDSNLKKTNIVVIGKNVVAVDLITLKILNLDIDDCELIKESYKRNLGMIDLEKIKIRGEKLDDLDFNIELCASKLEDINVKNFRVNSGQICSGCFKNAYHLLNFMKTYAVKDLKYNPNNIVLIGRDPPELENFGNIIIFGDCAIKTTQNSKFRTLSIESKKNVIDDVKENLKKKKKSQKKPKVKYKPNKQILELPGCPPDFFDCLNEFKSYYGKNNTPNLSIIEELLKTLVNPNDKKNLKAMEVI
ncbi:MAG: DUF362 domain-containing protein [Candidatus Thorarchaeota archaeon]